MKRITAFVVMLMILLQACVYAAVTDNNDMTVNIIEETEIADAMMNIDVILPGYTYIDLLTAGKSEYLDILAYSEQVVTDDKGVLNITFSLRDNSPSGNYTFIIKGKGYNKEITQFILNDELSKAAMDAIENALTGEGSNESKISAIKDAIVANTAEYNIDKTGYVSAFKDTDWLKSAALSYEYIKAENITEIKAEQISGILNKSVAVVALEKGLVENIVEDAMLFNLDNSELLEWYKKEYVKEFTGKRMAERLSGKLFESLGDFDEALIESFVLSVIEKPDGAGNTKEVMQAFSKYIGTGSSGKEKKYASVSDKNFSSYAELKEAFDEYKEPSSSNGSGSYGGGASGGGLGTKVPSVSIATTPAEEKIEQNKVEIYPLTIFNDLETVAWAEDEIITLTEKGIINGVGNNLFAPNSPITREEFSAMLVRAFIPDAQTAVIGFLDVQKEAWYYESVAKAYSAGIVNGTNENLFGTGQNITRQDMAVMLYRVSEYIKLNITVSDDYIKFEDDTLISDYAKTAVYALRFAKLINGVSDTEFAPLENATRAQAAKMIYGLLEL